MPQASTSSNSSVSWSEADGVYRDSTLGAVETSDTELLSAPRAVAADISRNSNQYFQNRKRDGGNVAPTDNTANQPGRQLLRRRRPRLGVDLQYVRWEASKPRTGNRICTTRINQEAETCCDFRSQAFGAAPASGGVGGRRKRGGVRLLMSGKATNNDRQEREEGCPHA